MIYEVEVSEQADSDLRGIFEYIAFHTQNQKKGLNYDGRMQRID